MLWAEYCGNVDDEVTDCGVFGDIFIVNVCFNDIFTFLYYLKKILDTPKEESIFMIQANVSLLVEFGIGDQWIDSLVVSLF